MKLLFFLIFSFLEIVYGQVNRQGGRRRWKGCILPEPPLHGYYEKVPPRYLRFTCNKGFILFGMNLDRTTKCVRGRWRDGIGSCRVDRRVYNQCPELQAPPNGEMFLLGSNSVGDKVEFYCDEGYVMDGSPERTCLSGRKWDGVQPVCQSRKTVEDLATALKENFIDKHAVASGSSGHRNSRLSAGLNGLDLVFLLDRSASIGEEALRKGREFMKMIVSVFGVSQEPDGGYDDTRVALLTFNDNTDVVFNLDDPDLRSVEAVNQKIDTVTEREGGTDLTLALTQVFTKVYLQKMMRDERRKTSANRAVFIITDAEETHLNRDTKQTIKRADALKKTRFQIFIIAVGRGIHWSLMSSIASPSYAHHVFAVDNFEDLGRVGEIISEKNLDHKGCGVSGNTFLTEFSGDSVKGAWPWLGWLSVSTNKETYTCGGALLCDRWFVTAAHCVYNEERNKPHPTKRIAVHLAEHSLYESETQDMMLKPDRVVIHPEYNVTVDKVHGVRPFDIALIDFGEDKKLLPTLNKYTRPICAATNDTDAMYRASVTEMQVQKSNQLRSKAGTVAGWGLTPRLRHQLPVQLPYPSLKQIKRAVGPDDQCSRIFPGLDTTKFFCVASYPETEECRAGDTGGPYMTLIQKWVAMIGIALKTENCVSNLYHPEHTSIYLDTLHPDIVSWLGDNLQGCNTISECRSPSNTTGSQSAPPILDCI